CATIEEMAAEYLAEVRERRAHGPYFLGGLCAGALVAIVMAQRLRAEGESVLPLLLLDPPERPFPVADSLVTDERLLVRLQRKQRLGRIIPRMDDPVYARASVRVAKAFERAVRIHRQQPYDGPVCMLST